MSRLLEGKRALITGGSRGLGRALAEVFAGEGARVCFTWNRNAEAAAEALAGVRAAGGPAAESARAEQVSVLDAAATQALVDDLTASWGGVDVLVNNAGITQNLPLALLDEADWDKVMDVNVKGAFLTSRTVLRSMIRRKEGVILNLGSLAGVRAIDAPVHYCTSKAALVGLTQGLAKEVGRYGIRVNCLAPGLLEGGLGVNLPEHRLKDYLHHCALGRVGTFEEVARFAAFLVSDRSTSVTGTTVVMDGGV